MWGGRRPTKPINNWGSHVGDSRAHETVFHWRNSLVFQWITSWFSDSCFMNHDALNHVSVNYVNHWFVKHWITCFSEAWITDSCVSVKHETVNHMIQWSMNRWITCYSVSWFTESYDWLKHESMMHMCINVSQIYFIRVIFKTTYDFYNRVKMLW